jgi:hypothetical protein
LQLKTAVERFSLSFKVFGSHKRGKQISCVFLRMEECRQLRQREWEGETEKGKREEEEICIPRKEREFAGISKQRHERD